MGLPGSTLHQKAKAVKAPPALRVLTLCGPFDSSQLSRSGITARLLDISPLSPLSNVSVIPHCV